MIDYAKAAGERGEKVVANIINKYANNLRKKQVLISNYMFRCNENRICQIDHLLITENGIFVIEVKNYSGVICGKPNDDKWYQKINGKEYEFYNPIKQNFGHIYKLRDIIGKKPIFHNIVVFTKADKSNIRNNMVMDLDEFEQKVFHESTPMLDGIYIDYYAEELLNYKYRIYNDPYKKIYNDVEDLDDDGLEEDDLQDDDVKGDISKDEDVEPDEPTSDDVEHDSIKDEDVKVAELTSDDLGDDDVKDDIQKDKDIKLDEPTSDDIEHDSIKDEDVKVAELTGDDLEDKTEKTEANTKTIENKYSKKNRKITKEHILAFTVICMAIMLLVFTPLIMLITQKTNTKPAGSIEKQPPEIIEYSKLGASNDNYIRATVKTKDYYNYLTVEFILYDENNDVVDIMWVTKKDLEKGGTYIFEQNLSYSTLSETHRFEASIKYYD